MKKPLDKCSYAHLQPCCYLYYIGKIIKWPNSFKISELWRKAKKSEVWAKKILQNTAPPCHSHPVAARKADNQTKPLENPSMSHNTTIGCNVGHRAALDHYKSEFEKIGIKMPLQDVNEVFAWAAIWGINLYDYKNNWKASKIRKVYAMILQQRLEHGQAGIRAEKYFSAKKVVAKSRQIVLTISVASK